MGYLHDIDAWLTQLLACIPSADDVLIVKKEVKAKILESYRNGQRDCPACLSRSSITPRGAK